MCIYTKIWNITQVILAPLLVVLPLACIMSSHLAEEVVFKRNLNQFILILLGFMYALYICSNQKLRKIFNVFAISSISAFLFCAILRRLASYNCSSFCFGIVNQLFGLACEYAEEGCLVENFLMIFFLILILFGLREVWRGHSCGEPE